MKSFKGFAALQKLCSLCIKLVRCKSLVCSRLKIMDYNKKEGKKPGEGLLKGEAVKRRVRACAFPGVIIVLKLLPGFKHNSNNSQVSALLRYQRLLLP